MERRPLSTPPPAHTLGNGGEPATFSGEHVVVPGDYGSILERDRLAAATIEDLPGRGAGSNEQRALAIVPEQQIVAGKRAISSEIDDAITVGFTGEEHEAVVAGAAGQAIDAQPALHRIVAA